MVKMYNDVNRGFPTRGCWNTKVLCTFVCANWQSYVIKISAGSKSELVSHLTIRSTETFKLYRNLPRFINEYSKIFVRFFMYLVDQSWKFDCEFYFSVGNTVWSERYYGKHFECCSRICSMYEHYDFALRILNTVNVAESAGEAKDPVEIRHSCRRG